MNAILFWLLLLACLAASTLWLLYEARQRWHDETERPLSDGWGIDR